VDAAAETALARHGEVIAVARELAERAGALRVVLLVDRHDDAPLMVDCDAAGDVEVTDGEAVALIPADAPAPRPPAGLIPDVRAIPATAITVDLTTGELAAPLGAIEHVAEALRQLARRLGDRSVATAELATRDPETPITLAAREGEPAVLAVGEQEFRLGG
jgi:hypothetical protein